MEYVVNNEVFSVSVRDYEGRPFNQALMYIQNVIKKLTSLRLKLYLVWADVLSVKTNSSRLKKKINGRTNKEWAPVMKQTNESKNNERTNDQTEETNKPANIRTKEPKNDNLRMKERTTKRMSQWGPRHDETSERMNELSKAKDWANGRTTNHTSQRTNYWKPNNGRTDEQTNEQTIE